MPAAAMPSSLRTQGPITTGYCYYARLSTGIFQNDRRGVWVPAFAGTTYFRGGRYCLPQPATCLMRAISSSTALSTGTFSLTTRFIALAQTFSLLRMVNFQFLVKSNGVVPPVNWL